VTDWRKHGAGGAWALLVAAALGLIVAVAAGQAPPATRTVDVVDQVHGTAVADPYRWLEEPGSSEVQEWAQAQNRHFEAYVARYSELHATILAELEKAYESSVSESIPAIFGERYFFSRRTGLQNHPVEYVRTGGWDKPEQVALDPNTFSTDGTVALDWYHPSPDGSLLAYGKSEKGSEKSTLYVRDLAGGKDLPDVIPNTRGCSVAWQSDGKGFLYTRYPAPGSVPAGDENYYRKVYHHRLGTDPQQDPLIFESADKTDWPNVGRSADGQYAVLENQRGFARNDLYVMPLAGPLTPTPLAVGLDALFSADVADGTIYIMTNLDAPRYRMLRTPVTQPAVAEWKEIIPQSQAVIESFDIVGGKLVLNLSENVYSQLRVYELDGRPAAEIKLPGIGTVGSFGGRHDRNELFFSFTSFTHPPTNFRQDLATGQAVAYWQKRTQVDPTKYETKQHWFASKDGTRVPMFVVNRKGLELNGKNPALLYGYGGFDVVYRPMFRETLFPWLDRGGVFALANIRGGGEFGRQWHDAGKLDKKQNVYDDFIAAAQALAAEKYTCPDKLAIEGGSNGGLLVGAVLVQRPDLCRAVVCQVPLLDMVRYHRFRIAELWTDEYGSPDDPAAFQWLYAYSPYHHVKSGTAYPAVLLTTALEDSRVDPMHAWKMGARLQAATSSGRPVFVWTETKAGHGQGKPLKMRLKEQADEYVFLMTQLGAVPSSPQEYSPPSQ